MKPRLRRASTIFLAALLAISACRQQAAPSTRELAVDLKAYMKELKGWEAGEKDVFQALAEVEKTYYVDDDFVIRRFKGALPAIEKHIAELAAYAPETADVKRVHEGYREGWAEMGEGFRAVISAVEAKDYNRLASAKNRVEAGRRKLLGAFGELDALLAEAEPELKNLRGDVSHFFHFSPLPGSPSKVKKV